MYEALILIEFRYDDEQLLYHRNPQDFALAVCNHEGDQFDKIAIMK